MFKKIGLAFGLLVAVMALSACGSTSQTITTEDGTVTANTGDTSSWCQTGADWNYAGNDGQEGSWKIVELVNDGGKYDGLCHVTFSGMGTEMDYYFDETGESGYVEMLMPTGETVSQSWSK